MSNAIYNDKCEELARLFLDKYNISPEQNDVNDLAYYIQLNIRNWLELKGISE